jgi:hypothetical protein
VQVAGTQPELEAAVLLDEAVVVDEVVVEDAVALDEAVVLDEAALPDEAVVLDEPAVVEGAVVLEELVVFDDVAAPPAPVFVEPWEVVDVVPPSPPELELPRPPVASFTNCGVVEQPSGVKPDASASAPPTATSNPSEVRPRYLTAPIEQARARDASAVPKAGS